MVSNVLKISYSLVPKYELKNHDFEILNL